jgi:TfoX/Sxy family transcriptional regulator of competence genes
MNPANVEQSLIRCTKVLLEIKAIQSQLEKKQQELTALIHAAWDEKEQQPKPKLVRIK